MGTVDVERLADATEQLSGADLKRVVEDGKLLYAFDRAKGDTLRPVTEYLLEALETVRANKARYAEAEASARARHPARPAYFDVPSGFEVMHAVSMGGLSEVHVSGMISDQT
jgi:hypothetical protein